MYGKKKMNRENLFLYETTEYFYYKNVCGQFLLLRMSLTVLLFHL